MARVIKLDQTPIEVNEYEAFLEPGLTKIKVRFPVTSEQYHEITTLLYRGNFRIEVPEAELDFQGEIIQFYTTVTNLYEKDQVGVFTVTFREVAK